jgi:hypothetical protein
MNYLSKLALLTALFTMLCACSNDAPAPSQNAEKQPAGIALPKSDTKDDTASFTDLFQNNENGSISPRTTVTIGSTTMPPVVSFDPNAVSIDGVCIATLKGKTFVVERGPNSIVVKSVVN